MKRIPLATLLGVLCFAVISTFTQHRAAADHSQQTGETPINRSNKTVVNDDGTVTTVSDDPAEGEFVPGELLVKFRNESDAVDAGRGLKNARGHLKMANPRLNEIFARFDVNNGSRPFARARLKSLAKVVKLKTQAGNVKEALATLRTQPESGVRRAEYDRAYTDCAERSLLQHFRRVGPVIPRPLGIAVN